MVFKNKFLKVKKLDENKIYRLTSTKVVAIHFSNKPTGKRDSSGRLKDNIKNEGWYLFSGYAGNMKAIKKLTIPFAIKLINFARHS
ncbi:MAG TPA: hypothetical protein VMZ91_07835 [Candidatus Paceibacterota bacterium]|nr:hypothetical protein [Candidatus Paceibacterota bacterium]